MNVQPLRLDDRIFTELDSESLNQDNVRLISALHLQNASTQSLIHLIGPVNVEPLCH